jgi:hypothetical protein
MRELLYSLRNLSYDIDSKNSMFDERSEELAFFESAISDYKFISELQRCIEAGVKISFFMLYTV